MTVVARALALILLLAGLVAVPPAAQAALPSEATWKADVRKAMAGSQKALVRRAEAKRPGEKLAINLDIDNTMLASGYDAGEPVGPTLAFAKRARSLGVTVFVNTARKQSRRAGTLRQLAAAGYRIDGLCMAAAGETVKVSKKQCRASFRARGFTLVANVGNSRTDFLGGGYEKAYRLPNYGGQLS